VLKSASERDDPPSTLPIDKIESSKLYGNITKVFNSLPAPGDQIDYVRAVYSAINLNSGSPLSHREICENFGFKPHMANDYYLVIAKSHATAFFVEQADLPGTSPRAIRDMDLAKFKAVLGDQCEPLVRGRSSYYFTPAEWIVALGIRATLPLPSALQSFVDRVGLDL
jgi:hypothetical protein